MPPSDRVAVVTGASSGIGEATARSLRKAGFAVVLGARREDRLMAVARELGGRGLPLDVRDPASIEAFVAAITAEYGQVEILVNNAGLAAGLQPLADGNDDDWVQMMETNVLGLLRVTEVEPGLVETEFSLVRFKGDRERASNVYQGMQPLTGADVADCIVWVVTRPPNVNIDEMVVRPITQATARDVARRS